MQDLDPIWIDWPRTRIRRALETDEGEVVRFVVQLEYNPYAVYEEFREDGWMVVARFDHDATPGGGHDVAEEGLHLDIYREGERVRRSWDFPPVVLSHAMGYGERYLQEHSDQLLARFHDWHHFDN